MTPTRVRREEIELPTREADPDFWEWADNIWQALVQAGEPERGRFTEEEAALILAVRLTEFEVKDYRKVKE